MPYHTTLRTRIRERDAVQELKLPTGVLRVVVQPERTSTTLHVGFNRQDVLERSSATARLGQPWDSSFHYREEGPIYFMAPLKGAFIRADVIYIGADVDAGGGGQDPTTFRVTFVPEEDKQPFHSDLAGSWPYTPRPLGWGQRFAWHNPMVPVIGAVGNDFANAPGVEAGTSLLIANAWDLKTPKTIPSTATISAIRVRMYGRKVNSAINQSDNTLVPNTHDVHLLRLSLIKDGIVQSYNYTDFPGNTNEVWPGGDPVWLEFTPEDDLLWGTSWNPADFTEGTKIHPSMTVTTVRPGIPPLNEKQRVSIPESTSGGSFDVTFKGVGTATMNYNFSAAQFATELATLSNIAPADINVIKVSNYWTVEFQGAYAGTDVPELQTDGTALIGAADAQVWRSKAASSLSESNSVACILEINRNVTSQMKLQRWEQTNQPGGETQPELISWWFEPENLEDIQSQLDALWGSGNTRAFHLDLQLESRLYRTLRWEFIGAYGGRDVRVEWELELTGNVFKTAPFRIVPYRGSSNFGNVGYFPTTPGFDPLACAVEYDGCGIIQIGGTPSSGGINEKQRIRILGRPVAGTWKITHEGEQTAAIPWPPSTADITTALENLTNIGGVTVSVIASDEWEIEFDGLGDAGREHDLLEVDVSLLTGGLATVVTVQESGMGQNEIQEIRLSGGDDILGQWGIRWDPGGGDETTIDIDKSTAAATVQAALEGLPSVVAGDVDVQGSLGGPWLIEFLQNYANTDVNPMRPKPGFGTSEWGIAVAAGLVINNETDIGQVALEIFDAELIVEYTLP